MTRTHQIFLGLIIKKPRTFINNNKKNSAHLLSIISIKKEKNRVYDLFINLD